MKHTQGNWTTKEGQIYTEEVGKTLALIPYFDNQNKEQKANAKLIAAAPELLESCIELLDFIERHFPNENGEAIFDAKRAINKTKY